MNAEFESEVRILEKKIPLADKKEQIVFFGSSSIRLWDTLSDDLVELNCLNIAFGGSTIEDCIAYYTRLLQQTNPARIVFYAGDNDIGQGASANMVLDRFTYLFDLIRKDFPLVPVTFISIKPSPERAEYLTAIQEANQKIQAYLSFQDNCSFVDVFSLMFDDTQINENLFIADRLHMNNKGYEIWKEALRNHLSLTSAVV